jgi:hypothetical protein
VSVAPGYPIRRWTDEQLDEHAIAGPHSTLTCQGCIQGERRAFEREAVARGEVAERFAEGWL